MNFIQVISYLNCKIHIVGTLRYNKKIHFKIYSSLQTKKRKNDISKLSYSNKEKSENFIYKTCSHSMIPNRKNIHSIRVVFTTSQQSSAKPLAVFKYNKGKCGIDYSDQMVFYATTQLKKLGIQLLLGILVVKL